MPPFDPEATALLVGDILCLSRGLDGSANFNIRPGAFESYKEALSAAKAQNTAAGEQYVIFQAHVLALYLPSLVALVTNKSLSDFHAVDPRLLSGVINFLWSSFCTAVGFRFVREHPARMSKLGSSLLQMILDCSNNFEADPNDPEHLWLLTDLLRIHNYLRSQDRISRDKNDTVDSLEMSPSLLTTFKTNYEKMGTFAVDAPVGPADVKAYQEEWRKFSGAVFGAEALLIERGPHYISNVIRDEGYVFWWACETQHPNIGLKGADRKCETVARDELMVCARCLAVRYCSKRHQKLHWKQHKPFCVAPTW